MTSNLQWYELVEDVAPDDSEPVAVLKLKQDLTYANLQPFQNFVRGKLLSGKRTIRLDFSQVKFIDSAGVGAMAALHKAARNEGGELVLLNTNATVRSILKIVGLDKVIKLEDAELPISKATPGSLLGARNAPPPPKTPTPTGTPAAALIEGEVDQDIDDSVSRLLLREMTVQGPTSPSHVAQTIITIQLKENVTYRNAQMVADGFLSYLRKGVKTLRADMSRVDFIDSAGVAALMQVARTFADDSGELILYMPSANLMRILKITKLDRVMTIQTHE